MNSSEAQYNVDPVIQIIELATGALPTAAALSGWVAAIEGPMENNGLLTGQAQNNIWMDNAAEAFVASTMFGNTYNGGTAVDPNATITLSIATAIIQAATGDIHHARSRPRPRPGSPPARPSTRYLSSLRSAISTLLICKVRSSTT